MLSGNAIWLKNARATYQCFVSSMFSKQIGKAMEVYLNDLLVKSTHAGDHCKHIAEMFNILKRYEMKLNSRKYAFGVSSGKFLGYMVNNRGIEANSKKIRAIVKMKALTRPQSLIGRIVALSRFVSKSTDRRKPFFDTLQGGKNFKWTSEC